MPFKIITGNFMKQEAEIMVIPTARNSSAPLTAVCERVYRAAGYDKMRKAREGFGELEFGDIVVTPGFDLNAHNVIHACVPLSRIAVNNNYEVMKTAYRTCFSKALNRAREQNAQSISFAFKKDLGGTIMWSTVISTIKTHLIFNDPCIDVYLVLQPGIRPVYENQEEQTKRESIAAENYTDCYSEYSMRFEEAFRGSGMLRDAFCRQYVESLLTLRITNAERLANTIDYDKGALCRFRNGQITTPRKHRVIAIAVAMELSDEERYNFIRCVGYKYPDDDRDRIVEKLMRSGVRDFKSVNEELCKINPEFALNAVSKKQKPTRRLHER